MTKIGIMSFAHPHANSYAAALNTLDNAALTAIWDDSPRRGRAAAKAFGSKFVKDLEKFLAMDLDGVIVCSENVHHRELVEKAAAAGKWILCEKPLSPATADIHAMRTACDKAKVGLGTAFPCRFSPPLIVAHDQIHSGAFGEVYAATCTNNGTMPGGWFVDEKLAGGGAIMDHTVHVADALRWITGKEFTKVYCEGGHLLHKGKFDVDDLGSLHMEMEGGIHISHIASWSRPKSFPTWGDVTMEIICEKGVIEVDAFRQKIDVYSDAAMKTEWAPYGGDPNLALVRDFVDAIVEKRPPRANGIDGLRATEVTVAAYKSLKSQRMVPL
ncbi:MAG: Gfo/Idh/MocA family protein [Candidatus Hydrogenedentota bacterium]